ncbi:carbohydrate ABC transporter permease [Microbispora corallina]|uniref:Sugar ABC transporter permease n=1 Tax=Microbispora corallina TaxID=83302 RepID=A0ABQ4FR70_9ACTN|nr:MULTISPECIES: carbohydrate ABC transporter permease [Microbispora]ETK36258.1 sugar ABC transporter permease [Microbispora sp. ATCC PTA-5024]GIH37313.1 sugar ABC transporter permease [Microbispora corallina]
MRDTAPPWARPLAALAVGAFFFVPLYVGVINTFKSPDQIRTDPIGAPHPFTLRNLSTLLTRPDNLYWASVTNSILVTGLSVMVLTVLSATLGHYLARSPSRWGRGLMLLLLCGLMIPPQVILAPVTYVLRAVGLMGTLPGLVLFNVGYYVPFGVFVFTGFMRSVPRDLEEAAAIDGATRGQIFWRIVFPLLRPATASVLIFLGVWIWNDFIDPLIILGPSQGTTITTGIFRSVGVWRTDYGTIFSLMFMGTIPVLVFYLFLQKHFVKGLTGGATKG